MNNFYTYKNSVLFGQYTVYICEILSSVWIKIEILNVKQSDVKNFCIFADDLFL